MMRVMWVFCFMCLVYVEEGVERAHVASKITAGQWNNAPDPSQAIQNAIHKQLTNILAVGVEWLASRLRYCAHRVVQLSQLATLEDPLARLGELGQQPAFLTFVSDAMRDYIHDLTDTAADFVTKSLKLRTAVWLYDLVFKHVSVVQFTKRVSRLKVSDISPLQAATSPIAATIDLIALREKGALDGRDSAQANLIFGKPFDQHPDVDQLRVEETRALVEALAHEQVQYLRAMLLADVQAAFSMDVVRRLKQRVLNELLVRVPISMWSDDDILNGFIATRSQFTEAQLTRFRIHLQNSKTAVQRLNEIDAELKRRPRTGRVPMR